jgi:hypothetical protein
MCNQTSIMMHVSTGGRLDAAVMLDPTRSSRTGLKLQLNHRFRGWMHPVLTSSRCIHVCCSSPQPQCAAWRLSTLHNTHFRGVTSCARANLCPHPSFLHQPLN